MDYNATHTLTGAQATTFDLMAQARKELGYRVNPIVSVFQVHYSSSLSLDRIGEMAKALYGLEYTPEGLRKILTSMVKGGYLRSRVSSRVRLWEVNY